MMQHGLQIYQTHRPPQLTFQDLPADLSGHVIEDLPADLSGHVIEDLQADMKLVYSDCHGNSIHVCRLCTLWCSLLESSHSLPVIGEMPPASLLEDVYSG